MDAPLDTVSQKKNSLHKYTEFEKVSTWLWCLMDYYLNCFLWLHYVNIWFFLPDVIVILLYGHIYYIVEYILHATSRFNKNVKAVIKQI